MQLESPGDTAVGACCADPSLPLHPTSQAAVPESSSGNTSAPDASKSSSSSSSSSTGQGDSPGALEVSEASTSSAAAPTHCSLALTGVPSQRSSSSTGGHASSSSGDKGGSTARSKDNQAAKPSPRPRALLEAAAQRLYAGNSAVKLAAAMTLLRVAALPQEASKAYIRAPVLLTTVAKAARLPNHAMLAILAADPCFEVLAAAGGSHSVVLNTEELLDRAAAAGQSQDVLTSQGTHTAAECVGAGMYSLYNPTQPGTLLPAIRPASTVGIYH